jgi:hypothetical protein
MIDREQDGVGQDRPDRQGDSSEREYGSGQDPRNRRCNSRNPEYRLLPSLFINQPKRAKFSDRCNLRQEVVNNPLACQDSISSGDDSLHKFSDKCNLRQEVVNNPLAGQDDITFGKFYYALYGGWAFPKTPYLFQTPLEACCWCISHFKRDGLSNIFGINSFPQFLNFIGVITTEVNNVEDCSDKVLFKSSIEREFFSGVKFHHIKASTAITAS